MDNIFLVLAGINFHSDQISILKWFWQRQDNRINTKSYLLSANKFDYTLEQFNYSIQQNFQISKK